MREVMRPAVRLPVRRPVGDPVTLIKGVRYSAEAEALFARATGLLSPAQKRRISRIIDRCKASGLWSTRDYLTFLKDAPVATLNWIENRYNTTLVGSIAHVPNRGVQNSGGSAKYGFIPSSAPSPKYALNDASIGVYVREPLAGSLSSGRIHIGTGDTGFSVVEASTSNQLVAKINTNGSSGVGQGGGGGPEGGLMISSRNSPTTTDLYHNTTVVRGTGLASAALPIREIYWGAFNSFGSVGSATVEMYLMAMSGAAVTDKQAIDLLNAILEYQTDIVAWGDSLTGGAGASNAGATAYPPVAGNAFSPVRDVANQGIGGQTSTQIAARMGAQPINVTLTSNQIPASGGVAVTAKSINPLYNSGSYTGSLTGTIAGEHGKMTTDASGNWTFTRTTPGSIVAVPAGTPFIPDLSTYLADAAAWFWLGRNGADAGYSILGDIAACVARLPHGRYLVGSIVTGSSDNPSAVAGWQAINASLSVTYGSRYVDVLGALQAANDGSANDLSDIAAGWVPRSLRSDAIHLNDAGYAIVAAQFKAKTLAMGW